ncbi:MAG: radical SAM protein [Candidatus Thorarchaeota archaeon]|nr:MAG: radical SAM protein [Candidatus Thorarchaeota archaeon]
MKASEVRSSNESGQEGESPEFVRTSLAASMTIGKVPGKFYRDAELYCINLLLTYDEGCHAKCAYCGLSGSRETEGEWVDSSFIRVDWPVFALDDIKTAITDGTCPHVERVCVSMITNRRAREDCIAVVSELKKVIPRISVLITPTIVTRDWLVRVKEAGADMVGIAVDAATREIFDSLRGKGVGGPHKWEKYWDTIRDSVEVFGRFNTGVHLIVGIGETEQEMIGTIQEAHDLGADTHLFSFFPEEGSVMDQYPQPPIGAYRRVQMARYIINTEKGRAERMQFNEHGQVLDFGMGHDVVENLHEYGGAFMTSGCSGESMDHACNRPFGNCSPYQASIGHWRNFPFHPEESDLIHVRDQLQDYSLEYSVDDQEFDAD